MAGGAGGDSEERVREHGQGDVLVRLVTNARYADLGPSAVVLHMASPTFDAAIFEIWGPLLNGVNCVVYGKRHIRFTDLAEVVRGAGITRAFFTTALFNAIVDETPEILRHVVTMMFGGEEPSVKHARKAVLTFIKLAAVCSVRFLVGRAGQGAGDAWGWVMTARLPCPAGAGSFRGARGAV
jgi:hypothetical protein